MWEALKGLLTKALEGLLGGSSWLISVLVDFAVSYLKPLWDSFLAKIKRDGEIDKKTKADGEKLKNAQGEKETDDAIKDTLDDL